MKKNDIILICCVLVGCALIFGVLLLVFGGSGKTAVVLVDGEEYARLPLDVDTQLTIEAGGGYNILTVKDGEAYISEADCPDKTCVKTGKASELKTVVCLPHRVTVSVEES